VRPLTYIPPEERDLTLKTRLKTSAAEGFFAAVVDACLLWQREGLDMPESVKAATKDYRDESDTLGDFIEEHLLLEQGATVTLANVHTKYVEWAEGAGHRRLLARNSLARELNEREVGQPGRDASNRAVRNGMRLRTLNDDPEHVRRDSEAAKAIDDTLGMVVDDGKADDTEDWLAPGSFVGTKH